MKHGSLYNFSEAEIIMRPGKDLKKLFCENIFQNRYINYGGKAIPKFFRKQNKKSVALTVGLENLVKLAERKI